MPNFIETYSKYTIETMKIKACKKSTEKIIYMQIDFFMFMIHDAKSQQVLSRCRSILLKSTSMNSDAQPVPFNCTIDIEHRHNHPVNSFHALSFKYLRENDKSTI